MNEHIRRNQLTAQRLGAAALALFHAQGETPLPFRCATSSPPRGTHAGFSSQSTRPSSRSTCQTSVHASCRTGSMPGSLS
jgi:hypothetical protein